MDTPRTSPADIVTGALNPTPCRASTANEERPPCNPQATASQHVQAMRGLIQCRSTPTGSPRCRSTGRSQASKWGSDGSGADQSPSLLHERVGSSLLCPSPITSDHQPHIDTYSSHPRATPDRPRCCWPAGNSTALLVASRNDHATPSAVVRCRALDALGMAAGVCWRAARPTQASACSSSAWSESTQAPRSRSRSRREVCRCRSWRWLPLARRLLRSNTPSSGELPAAPSPRVCAWRTALQPLTLNSLRGTRRMGGGGGDPFERGELRLRWSNLATAYGVPPWQHCTGKQIGPALLAAALLGEWRFVKAGHPESHGRLPNAVCMRTHGVHATCMGLASHLTWLRHTAGATQRSFAT